MSKNTTIDCYDTHSGEYDEIQFAIIPHYEDVLKMTADACKHYIMKNGRILDLGCGSGNTSLYVLKDNPSSKMFMMDGSKEMVGRAAEKLKKNGFGSAIEGSKVADFGSDDWDKGLGGFDAIVSTFVLEHLEHDKYKKAIRKCYDLLKPGGIIITMEPGDNEFGMEEWLKEKIAARVNLNEKYKKLSAEFAKNEKHYFANINDKIQWWKDAGFKDVHTIWQYLFLYLTVGTK